MDDPQPPTLSYTLEDLQRMAGQELGMTDFEGLDEKALIEVILARAKEIHRSRGIPEDFLL